MTIEATQAVIDTIMADEFAQMSSADIELINAYLVSAKIMRNLIWTKLKAAMEAGRITTRTAACNSLGQCQNFVLSLNENCISAMLSFAIFNPCLHIMQCIIPLINLVRAEDP